MCTKFVPNEILYIVLVSLTIKVCILLLNKKYIIALYPFLCNKNTVRTRFDSTKREICGGCCVSRKMNMTYFYYIILPYN